MKYCQNQKGFTVLETIVALGIVMVGLLGVASLSRQNIAAQGSNKNFFLASVLAQEAVELVRNQRDNNWRAGASDWQTGGNAGANTDILQDLDNYNYGIQYDGDIRETINNIDDARLYLDSGGNYVYDSTGNTETPFYRLVTIDSANSDSDHIEFNVVVKWNEQSRSSEYRVDARLYNWW